MAFWVAPGGWSATNQLLSLLGLTTLFYVGKAHPSRRTLWRKPCTCPYLNNSFAYRAGTARFDPPNPFSIAKFTPITFPSRLNRGPPDPPEVVAASYTILSCNT